MQNEPIGNKTNLFKSLVLAQSQIEHAHKSATNDAFKKGGKASKYANIEDVIDAIKLPAKDNGLCVFFEYKTQMLSERVEFYIRYVIVHISGESYISEWVLMLLRDENLHAYGAANTYMRRQLLKSIYQIPEDDDDGNSQSIKPKEYVQAKPAPKGNIENTKMKPLPNPPPAPQQDPNFPHYEEPVYNADAHFDSIAENSAEYKIKFGPLTGQRLYEQDKEKLRDYVIRLRATNPKQENVLEFLTYAENYLNLFAHES